MNQQRDPKWISPSNSSTSPPSCVRRSLPVIIRYVARIPLRVRVSGAQARRIGPLSSIGPPCLLSPYHFCQYSTGILTGGAGGGGVDGQEGGRRGQLSTRRLLDTFSLKFTYTLLTKSRELFFMDNNKHIYIYIQRIHTLSLCTEL